MTRASWFTLASVLFLTGVGLGAFVSVSWLVIYSIVLACLVTVILAVRIKIVLIAAVVILFAAFGLARSMLSESIKDMPRFIGMLNGRTLTVDGTVYYEPDIRETHQKITLVNVVESERDHELAGRLLLLTDTNRTFFNGDRIRITCTFEEPAAMSGFAYDKYLARFDIYSICPFPKTIARLSSSRTFSGSLLRFKGSFKNKVIESISEPEASLLLGLLLGERRGLGDVVSDAFRRVGLSHIVALSGYNISILVGMFVVFGRYIGVPRRLLFGITTVGIFLFVLMTGASPSVTRAGIMGWLVLLAYEVGRKSYPLNLLLLAAVIMVLISPGILLWDIGFQLSFMATYALLSFAPFLNTYVSHFPNPFAIREIVTISISAIIFTMPLTLWHFNGWSVIAPLANVLVLPVIPLSMALGLAVGTLGGGIFLSFVWVWPSWLVLHYIITVSKSLADLPFSYVTVAHFPFALMVLSYAALFAAVFILKRKQYDYERL